MSENDFGTVGHHEDIIQGACCDWYANGRIVAYTLSAADEGIMQAWAEKARAVLEDWPADQPYRALHDLSAPGCAIFYMLYAHYHILNAGVSPEYYDSALKRLAQLPQPSRVAIHLSLSLSGRLTNRSTGGITEQQEGQPVFYKTFFNREKALEWLALGLE